MRSKNSYWWISIEFTLISKKRCQWLSLVFPQIFRNLWMQASEKRSYVPIRLCAIAFFCNATRARSRLPTVAASPFLSFQIWSISLAFSRESLKSASTLRTVATGRFSLIPRSFQHVPTSSHIFSTSKSLTTAVLAPSTISKIASSISFNLIWV